ncbi:MAG: polysaccharide deacetylase family protein [Methylocystaceae bacterium]
MLERYQLWLAWMLAIGLSVSSSIYLTSQIEISTIKPISHQMASKYDTTAQAAVAESRVLSDATPAPEAAVSGKLADGVPILMYHSIANADNKLCVKPGDLEQQLDYLVQEGYHTITVKQLLAAAQGQTDLPPKPLVITFDDGYRDNYTVAYPMLKKRGMVATIYVITRKIGTPDGISAEELREMAANGIEIGSHTWHHVDLRSVNNRQLVEEITVSRQILLEILQVPIDTFCYPSGRYTLAAIKQVEAAGYQGAVTTTPGVVSDRCDPWLIPRIRVNGGESLQQFIASIPRNI